MDLIRQYVLYAILIGIFCAVMFIVPRCASVHVPPDYTDIDGIEAYKAYALDESVGLGQLKEDDPVCFRLGREKEQQVYFGWVAALPGDEVSIAKGELLVNGHAIPRAGKLIMPGCAPLRIPANHLFVISSSHEHDSLVNGPLPLAALRGRIGSLP